ncbi:MAG: hypothetical protein MJ151_00100, partial [Lachnospiraceae bacterium]|nr:hypothetical protein [Lachnospiraceae bacterium]
MLRAIYTDDTIQMKACGAPNTNRRDIQEYVICTVSESTASNARKVWSDVENRFIYEILGYHVNIIATESKALCDHEGFEGIIHT